LRSLAGELRSAARTTVAGLSGPERRGGRARLRPAGAIIVSLPNIANLRVRLGLLFGRFDYTDSGILDRTHLRFFTLRSARELMREAGYRITREAYSGYSMPRWLIDLVPSLFAVNIIMMGKTYSKSGSQEISD